ncbi:mitochondrial ribosomal protein subunit L20-domain-containing protein [Xylaria bambusicola]|uniref:mitochondrial ribosomal protein subunit L20-domain-containing protein n=1 Tax=Xylaria bambusicola TaxID=326684 RepID=UPI00200764D7|nr:mitochondrial ribosomal protein subunit L20-domain-containing protein [Xylaria bambusicola]KAI0521803.1 mitochondrial ribosomal protein subunit L20-domain-containing protein [Xylaria bambusicola]
METRQVLRPLGSLSHATSSVTRSPAFRSTASRRHQSTTSRTKKMLKIPPHPDFLTPQSGQNHIIYNPPAAAPSVYHTPFKFLPKSDPRRQANLSQLVRSSTDLHASRSSLPPVSRATETREKKYNVTREQVEEMRHLRASDPVTWSVHKLAEKFQCGPLFVMMCCKASPEHKEKERQRLEAIKARWGEVRTKARGERQKRKVLLAQGAL